MAKKILLEVEIAGGQDVAQVLQRVKASAEEVGSSAEQASKKVAQQEAALQRLLNRLEPTRVAEERLTKQQELLRYGFASGKVDAERFAAGMAQLDAGGGALQNRMVQLDGALKLVQFSILGTALYKLGEFYMGNVKAAAEAEEANSRLAAVYRATGGAAGITVEQLKELASSMQHLTGIDDENVKGAEAILLTYSNISGKLFPEVLARAEDLSHVFGGDLAENTRKLGEILESPAQGLDRLRRLHIILSEAQKEHIKELVETRGEYAAQIEILQLLRDRVGEAARVHGETFTGSVDKLRSAWADLRKEWGNDSMVMQSISVLGIPMLDFLENWTAAVKRNREEQLSLADILRGGLPGFGAASGSYHEAANITAALAIAFDTLTTSATGAGQAVAQFGEATEPGQSIHNLISATNTLGTALATYFSGQQKYTVTVDTQGAHDALSGLLDWIATNTRDPWRKELTIAALTTDAQGNLSAFQEWIADPSNWTDRVSINVTATASTDAAQGTITGFKQWIADPANWTDSVSVFATAHTDAAQGTIVAFEQWMGNQWQTSATVTAQFVKFQAEQDAKAFVDALAALGLGPDTVRRITADWKDAEATGNIAAFSANLLDRLDAAAPTDPDGSRRAKVWAAFLKGTTDSDVNSYIGTLAVIPRTYPTLMEVSKDQAEKDVDALVKYMNDHTSQIDKAELDAMFKPGTLETLDIAWNDAVDGMGNSLNHALTGGIQSGILDIIAGDSFSSAWKDIWHNLSTIAAGLVGSFLSRAVFGATDAAGNRADGLLGTGGLSDIFSKLSSLQKAGLVGGGILLSYGAAQKNQGAGLIGGAASGASIGSMILPGWGTAIGAIVGAIAGYFMSRGDNGRSYEVSVQRNAQGGMSYGVMAPTDDATVVELARQLKSKTEATVHSMRVTFDMLGTSFDSLPALSLKWKDTTDDWNSTWQTIMNSSLPLAIFHNYESSLITSLTSFGASWDRVHQEMVNFETIPFDQAIKALQAWIGAMQGLMDLQADLGKSLDDVRAEVNLGSLDAFKSQTNEAMEQIAKLGEGIASMTSAEQVEVAGQLTAAIQQQNQAFMQEINNLEQARQAVSQSVSTQLTSWSEQRAQEQGPAAQLAFYQQQIARAQAALAAATNPEQVTSAMQDLQRYANSLWQMDVGGSGRVVSPEGGPQRSALELMLQQQQQVADQLLTQWEAQAKAKNDELKQATDDMLAALEHETVQRADVVTQLTGEADARVIVVAGMTAEAAAMAAEVAARTALVTSIQAQTVATDEFSAAVARAGGSVIITVELDDGLTAQITGGMAEIVRLIQRGAIPAPAVG